MVRGRQYIKIHVEMFMIEGCRQTLKISHLVHGLKSFYFLILFSQVIVVLHDEAPCKGKASINEILEFML